MTDPGDWFAGWRTFVLDIAGKEVLARIFNPTASRDIPDGLIIHRRVTVNDWSQLRNEWIMLHSSEIRSFHFTHWIYSGREVKSMFIEAGFTDIRVFGDYGGTTYGPDASRLVVIGRKPKGAA
jgi:hypothetical protein